MKQAYSCPPIDDYPVLAQWLKYGCSTTSMMHNTVKDESLAHPTLSNVAFSLVRAVDSYWSANENFFNNLFTNNDRQRFYQCFDLARYGYVSPVIAYIAKRHYCYRIFRHRFGIRENSYEGSKIRLDNPATYLREALRKKRIFLPLHIGDSPFFDSIAELVGRMTLAYKSDEILAIPQQGIYGLSAADTICNLCMYDMNYLRANRDEVLRLFSEHKGFSVLEDMKKAEREIMNKGCLYCVGQKETLVGILS